MIVNILDVSMKHLLDIQRLKKLLSSRNVITRTFLILCLSRITDKNNNAFISNTSCTNRTTKVYNHQQQLDKNCFERDSIGKPINFLYIVLPN